MTHAVSLTGGSPGVGCSTLTVALAMTLAQKGFRVCLLDADWGPNNVSVLLRIKPERTLVDLLDNRAELNEIIQRDVNGIDIIPGDSAPERMSALTSGQLQLLVDNLSYLEDYDYLLIDVAAGLDRAVTSFLAASDHVSVIITPAPESLDDASSLFKRLHRLGYTGSTGAIINRCRNQIIGRHSYGKLREIIKFYLDKQVPLQGMILEDKMLSHEDGQGISLLSSDVLFSHDMENIAQQLERESDAGGSVPVEKFWQRFLEVAGVEQRPDWKQDVIKTSSELNAQLETLSSKVEVLIERLQKYQSVNENQPADNTTDDAARDKRQFIEEPGIGAPEKEVFGIEEPETGAEYWLQDVDYQLLAGESEYSVPLYRIEQRSGSCINCTYYDAS